MTDVKAGEQVIALGAHLLQDARERTHRATSCRGGELMSFNLSRIAVRERAVTLFFIVLLAAAGAYAFIKLGRAEDPSFTIKTLTVTTVWPGATAARCRTSFAEPLEKNAFRN